MCRTPIFQHPGLGDSLRYVIEGGELTDYRHWGKDHSGKFKILVVQSTDLFMLMLPKIHLGPAQNTKLHVNVLGQVVQNSGSSKIYNTDGARATPVSNFPVLHPGLGDSLN